MSGAEEGERSHAPTERRLAEARERGEIARSADLTTAAAWGGFLLVAATLGPAALTRAGQAGAALLAGADRLAPDLLAAPAPRAAGLAMAFGAAILPLFAAPAAAALLALAVQRALIFTPSRLKPKLSRISPLAMLGQKFGPDGLFDFARSTAKLALFAGALGLWLLRRGDLLLGMMHLGEAPRFLGVVVLIAAVIGVADWLWQMLSLRRRLRMTRQELVEEHRNAEGDGHVKAARRARAQEIATNRMLRDVPRADVVIVNPTHYAVALKWTRGSGRAPVVVAKGADEIAARIRALALGAGVPIHSDPPTARLLHAALRVGQEIRPEHYRAVAAAIRFAEAMRRRARGRAAPR